MLAAHRLITVTVVILAFVGCKPSDGVSTPALDGTSKSPKEVTGFEDLEYNKDTLIHHDDAGRVKVKIQSAWTNDGSLVVRAKFIPDDPGFHLYSAELPRSGVNGVGRPTLLEVSAPEELLEIGKLVSNKESLQKLDQTLNLVYQVYDDGPVTLYLPLRFKEAPAFDFSLPVKLTYMSCGEKTCNVPIESAEETLKISVPSQH